MKIGIVGAGMVGSTTAYALIMQGVGREIVLVDQNETREQAEADDLKHAIPFSHAMQVRGGDYADLAGARVVVITAGVNQKPGETRLQLLERNSAIFRDIVPKICHAAPDAILLVATNPVDVMTHLTARIAAESGSRAGNVLGSGTTLDTARYRMLVGEFVGIDSHHVHVYVVGEHGDSEVLTWSAAQVAGLPLADLCASRGNPLTDAVKADIDLHVRKAAYSIIQGKGSTYYGVGSALARIVRAILSDHRAVLTVCSPVPEVEGVRDVTLALPHLVGAAGVLETFPLRLDEAERAALRNSAEVLRNAIAQIGL
jgi:L-lactate dehydrogenase